jgi:hypothetical protein
MFRILALLLTLACLVHAPVALAQSGGGGAFGPLPPAQPAETPVPDDPVDQADDGQVSRQTLFLIAAGVIASFFVLGWLITRDARRNLNETDRAAVDGIRTTPASRKQDLAKAKQRARQKTRAQRQARKKTRRANRG